ncbi:MAG: efflux RND transporter periplasmic adaptor subunit [Campylobacterota bacterium]|nr:efflux RND transporter periplasmic adaptor subunit [Campylobacterota bacterium]
MKKIILVLAVLSLNLFANKIYATFEVQALKSANIAFSSSGIINNIYVDIGSIVKKDENLASLNNSDIKAALDMDKTALKYAKKDYDRQIKIKHIIDEAKFDSYAYKYELAKDKVTYQKAILNKTILKAPFDGVIISKELEVGDVVSGQMIKTAFKIQSSSKRKLVLEFDQKYHNDVKIGDKFSYTLDGDAKTYTGTISKIYPFANTKNRKIKAEVITKDILVGLFGDGYIK